MCPMSNSCYAGSFVFILVYDLLPTLMIYAGYMKFYICWPCKLFVIFVQTANAQLHQSLLSKCDI
jgi:hypothetical protein